MKNILLGAEWCGPCKGVKKFLDQRGVRYTYIDVDTEEGMKLAGDWGVRAVPSMNVSGNIITGDSKIKDAFDE